MSDPIVGIDLGTSNSVVAYCDATGAVRVLSDEAGFKIHPSVVSFHPSGGVVVGAAAKQRKVIDPGNTIYSVKRLLGRTFGSPEVKTAQARSPFQIKEGANQMPMVVTRGGDFAVPEISAIVLDHVRNLAATALDTEVSRAVVTVPASFNDAQRTATATAGAIAGITVMRVLNEPTAAALAYGHSRNLKSVIAVYDFGGGTFDITLLKLHDEVYEVLGTAGDSFLGGDDLDERIVDKMVNRFLADHRIDLRTNEVAMMRLRAVAEQTKIELSRRSRAVVRIDEIAYGPKGAPLNLQIELTRDEFVSQVADIIDRTFPVCKDALALAGLNNSDIDDIILVGGTTKIPYVRDQVSKFFGKAPRTDVNPEEAVAVGGALQASALERTLQKQSARLPVVDSTQTDYEFGVEDESLTMPQGAKGEPTDPRAKLAPADQAAADLRPKKPTSVPVSAVDEDGEEIEGADTNVSKAPTATDPNIKKAPERKSGEYSAQSVTSDKLDEKAAKAIGRLNSAKQSNSNIGPMGKVPARKFGEPLPPVTRMEPKVDPRLRRSGPGIGGKPPTGPVPIQSATPPPVPNPAPKSTQPFGKPELERPRPPTIDPRGETAVAMDVPETPLPMIPTTPGIGGPLRTPTIAPVNEADGDELMPPPPPKRVRDAFQVVDAPNSVMTALPDADSEEPAENVPLGAAGASDLPPENTQEMPDDFSDLEMGAPGQTIPPLNIKTNPGAKIPTKPLPAPKAPNPARTMMGGQAPPAARPAPPPSSPPPFVPPPAPPPLVSAQPTYVPPAPPAYAQPTQAMAPFGGQAFVPASTQAMPPGPPPPSPFEDTALPMGGAMGGGLFDELNFPTDPPQTRAPAPVTGPPPMGGPMAPSPYGQSAPPAPFGGPMAPAPVYPQTQFGQAPAPQPPPYVPPPYVPPPPAPPMAPPAPPSAPYPVPAPPPARAPVVLDVTPRGLGIGTVAGYCEELIRRNSRLPAQQRKVFTTSRDSQEVVRIVVCQGESRRMDNNAVLGDLVLEGLPPRPRGETSIEVTFTLDASGILQVRARDAQTGAEQRASLDLLGAMPEGDVDAARERLQALRR